MIVNTFVMYHNLRLVNAVIKVIKFYTFLIKLIANFFQKINFYTIEMIFHRFQQKILVRKNSSLFLFFVTTIPFIESLHQTKCIQTNYTKIIFLLSHS